MAIPHTSKIILRVFAAAVVAFLLMAVHAEARINKVVPEHVGMAFRTLAVSSSSLFPLQSGLNKVTIQGDAAMLNVKSVTLNNSLKANIKIVGRGANYLHLNITISKEARIGKTGDGILNQRIRKGTPEKFRWKVYERGTALSIEGPASVQFGSEHRITFRGEPARECAAHRSAPEVDDRPSGQPRKQQHRL